MIPSYKLTIHYRKNVNIGADGSEQTLQTHLRCTLVRVYTICHATCIFFTHCLIVRIKCSILRHVYLFLGVPIFTFFTVTVLIFFFFQSEQGDIIFSLGYLSSAERLTVVIMKARNLRHNEEGRITMGKHCRSIILELHLELFSVKVRDSYCSGV